jgi:DNA-binding MarR family transcriptional regulator
MRPSGQSVASTAEDLLDSLLGLHGLMRRQHRGDEQHGGVPEKRGQFRLLRVLFKRGRLTMQELAASLDVAPPTVTGMIKRLLEQGYVERVHDDADWRNVWIELTEEGREAIVRHHRERAAALQELIEQLDEEEHAKLKEAIPVLDRLLELGA